MRAPNRPRNRSSLGIVLLLAAMSFGVLFMAVPNAAAITYVRGPISVDTTWGIADTTYVLTGHVTVRSGVTLTILPGTTVRVDPGVFLFVDGTLRADGAPGNPILFRANASFALFPPIGVQFNVSSGGSVTWSSFVDRFERPVTVVDSSPTIRSNTIAVGFWGVAAFSSGAAPAAPLIADNTILRATVGVYLISSTARVERNAINGTTVGVQIVGSGAPEVRENTITNVSSGFALGVWAQPGATTLDIRDNTIRGVQGTRGTNGIGAGAAGGTGGIAIGILLDGIASAAVDGNTVDQVFGGRGGDGAENPGGTGGRGGAGGAAAAIAVVNTPDVQVNFNTITNLVGGRGGAGGGSATTGWGGDGGPGGDAYGIQVLNAGARAAWYGNAMDVFTGGAGGWGGLGSNGDGNGTRGGSAVGLFALNARDGDATGNLVTNLRGGLGGNSTALGAGGGRPGGGGEAVGLLAVDVTGTATFHANVVSDLSGGDGGRAKPEGAWGGNATGILAFGRDDGRFNATTASFNTVQFLTAGDGGGASDRGGPGGTAAGIVVGRVTPTFAANGILALQGGAGGDALDGSDGGRGGDAAAFGAFLVRDGWSNADAIDGVTKGAAGAGPPAQVARGVGYYMEGNATFTSVFTIENATIANVGDADLYVNNYTEATTINTPFNGATVVVEAAGNLTVKNYLAVEAFWPDGTTPVAGATILVYDNGDPVYSIISPTGAEAWLLVTDRIYINSATATENETDAEVSYLSYAFASNPRAVDMSSSRTETFVMIDGDAPTSSASALPTYTSTRTFNVSYTASDGTGGGLNNITLWYRLNGGAWTAYATQPASTSGTFAFSAPADGTYEFATTADDLAGNVEPGPGANDTWTIVDTVRPGSRVASLSTYQTTASFLVSWAPDANVTDIVSYTIQYNRGAGWANWLVDTTATSGTFTASPAWGVYQFRSIARDAAGNVEVAPATNDTWTVVDTEPPASTVLALSPYQTTLAFTVYWGPVGDSFDIATYRIEVNDNGGGWTVWIGSTSNTSASYPGSDGHLYQFRSIATDRAGNVESAPAGNDTWTLVDVTPPDSRVATLQPYYTTLSFTVSWGPASGTTDIATYTLEVSDNDGPWTTVSGSVNTPATSAVFIGSDGHRYAFRTLARDRAGNVETAPAGNDTWTVVDVTRPFVTSGAPRGANVNATPVITITFSEPMDRASVEQAFSLSPDMNGAFVWSADSRTVSFMPERPLEYGTRYVVAIDSSARDLAGNTATGLYTFDFTTVDAPAVFGLADMWWVLAAIVAAVGGSLFLLMRRRGSAAKPAAGAAAGKEAATSTVDDVFLLYRDGVLIKHETRRLKPDIDTDILSGMLTAVQQFVKDSFRTEEGELDELTFGQMHILIGRGKWLILAAMIQGDATEGFSAQIQRTIQDIEDHQWDQLEDWDGDMAIAKLLTPYVKKLIRGEYA